MRAYIGSSALLKRVFAEPSSASLTSTLVEWSADGHALICSSLGWIEVSRALRSHLAGRDDASVNDLADAALAGVLKRPMNAETVALARRVGPSSLRTLGAIHLASALLTDADLLIAYDVRLLDAAHHHGLTTASPGEGSSRS